MDVAPGEASVGVADLSEWIGGRDGDVEFVVGDELGQVLQAGGADTTGRSV